MEVAFRLFDENSRGIVATVCRARKGDILANLELYADKHRYQRGDAVADVGDRDLYFAVVDGLDKIDVNADALWCRLENEFRIKQFLQPFIDESAFAIGIS